MRRLFDDIDAVQNRRETLSVRLATGHEPTDRHARTLVESWFEELPSETQPSFSQRLRSDDVHFLAAFFELFLHALFLRLGYTAVAEPKVSMARDCRPDFLMWRNGSPSFYLEATIVDEDPGVLGEKRRLALTARALRQVVSSNFDLLVEEAHFAENKFPRQLLIRSVQAWLDSLDPVEVDLERMCREGHGRAAHFEHEGLSVRVWAVPREFEHRGPRTSVRARVIAKPVVRIACADAVRAKLVRKKRHYGELHLPYIIAVNALEPGCDVEEIWNAAFGTLTTHVFGPDAGRYQTVTVRSDDGAISAAQREGARRVSAVLAEVGLTPWSMFDERRSPVLLVNPEATFNLSYSNMPFLFTSDARGGSSLKDEGYIPAGRILGLETQSISPMLEDGFRG